jgi:enoyl-CoA hydratase/carnithine racemase
MAYIHSKKNVDWTMSATEALKMGLIDHIGIPRIAAAHLPTQLVNAPTHAAHSSKKKKKRAKKP